MLKSTREEDEEYYHSDPDRYMAEAAELREQEEKRFRAFMGERFATAPLRTKAELEEWILDRSERIKRYTELKAPEDIIEAERSLMNERIKDLTEKRYIRNIQEQEYRLAYDRRCDKWRDQEQK